MNEPRVARAGPVVPGKLAERAREIADGTRQPAVPRDAATVILIRQAGSGVEAFLLRAWITDVWQADPFQPWRRIIFVDFLRLRCVEDQQIPGAGALAQEFRPGAMIVFGVGGVEVQIVQRIDRAADD